MKEQNKLENINQRRALRLEFTAGLFIGIAEGVFFCWLASML